MKEWFTFLRFCLPHFISQENKTKRLTLLCVRTISMLIASHTCRNQRLNLFGLFGLQKSSSLFNLDNCSLRVVQYAFEMSFFPNKSTIFQRKKYDIIGLVFSEAIHKLNNWMKKIKKLNVIVHLIRRYF